MNTQAFSFSRKIGYLLASLALAVPLLVPQAALAALGIAQQPLFLATNVPPNITLTLDDSGSMAWAYVPDTMGGNRYTNRYKSSTFNALYYNPNVTYDAPVDASGNTYSTSFTCAYIDGFDTSLGCIDLSSDYAAPVSYTPGSSYQWVVYANGYYSRQWPTYNAYSTSDAYYYVYDSSCTLSGGTNNDGCYTRVDVSSTSGPGGTDERQNFANWYSFYRTRNLSVVSGSSLAFAQLNDQTRVAWQVLNRCRAFGSSQRCGWNNSYYDNQLARFTGTHKDNFYSWLSRLPASGGTPLRAALARAGAMYETSRPYQYDPGVTSTPTYACRQNYSIIMTDGIWNGSVTSFGNQDGSDHTLPDGTSYVAADHPPFTDNNSTSLADIAYYYWRTDLRSTLSDSGELKYEPVTTAETVTSGGTSQTIQPYWNPKNDPASWQHMVTFTVGVGLGSWLTSPQWGGDTYAAPAYDAFASGATNWPTTGSDAAPENVYDLYHAAIDSRGQFFSAENPNDIVTAFKTIIQRIQNRTGSSSSASFSTGRLLASSQAFLATFDSADWSGDLAARPISDGTGNLTCTPTSLYPRGAFCPPAWHAQTVLNTQNWDPTSTDANRRQIVTTAGGVGVPFTWSNLSSTEQTALEDGGTATDGQNRLDWLRGDRAQEVKNGGSYRNRTYVLGDIVNSSPVYQPAPDFDYNYYTASSTFKWQDVLHGTTGPETDYATFQSAHKTRLNLVWVGSNDGFLHAFKAGHYDSSGTFQNSDNNGQEQFAFMPKVAMQNAATLADPNYRTAGLHHYFVDGQMEITDAFFKKPADSAAAWHSVLVGGMGAGGQEIYALDVTNPSQLTEANAASTVMWEFTDADDADLGDTYGKPHIVRLHNDEWGVLVNNGFGNTIADSHVGSGHAVLYVLDLATGSILAKLDTGSGSTSDPNGLAESTPIDLDGDGVTDYVYAADLHGNVWRFDLTAKNPSQWHVSKYGNPKPTPLFEATDASTPAKRQPITTKVVAESHPKGRTYGVMVYFGTGKYIENNDNIADTSTNQTFYGIWDHDGFSVPNTGTAGTPAANPPLTRADLLQQQIIYENTIPGYVARVLTQNKIDWSTDMGWYVDLEKPDPSDTGAPTSWVRQGEMVVADPVIVGKSVTFSTLIPSSDPCSTGGSGWLMALDLASGGRMNYQPFHLGVPGIGSVGGIQFSTAAAGSPSFFGGALAGSTKGGQFYQLPFMTGEEGRKSWRIIR